jgi:phosphatidylserine decarboxylase
MFRIHKEGYRIFTFASIFLCLVGIAGFVLFPGRLQITVPLLIFISLIILFIARFFRVPDRKTMFRDQFFYSPADGTIVAIEKTYEEEFLKEERIQVSIFMSVWDVHINFFPISGKVIYFKHHPGKYLVARHPKSSALNERSTIVIEDKNNIQILLRQIAGIVARRIVCYAKPELKFNTGDELGFIKFGSRVDIFLPPGTEILAKMGDHVTGSITPIAKL